VWAPGDAINVVYVLLKSIVKDVALVEGVVIELWMLRIEYGGRWR
jgi:hypothetical protein